MPKFYVFALEVYALIWTSTDMKQQCQCLTPHLPLIPVYIQSQLGANTAQPKQKISKGLFQSCAKVYYVCLLLEAVQPVE